MKRSAYEKGAPNGAPSQPISDTDRSCLTELGEDELQPLTFAEVALVVGGLISFAILLRELRAWGLQRARDRQ